MQSHDDPTAPRGLAGAAAEVSVAELGAQEDAEWCAFVAASPRAELYHDLRWRDIIRDVFRGECHYLLARGAAGDVCGALPLVRLRSRLFGDFLVSLPYFNYGGVLATTSSAERALVGAAASLAGKLGSTHVELRHRASQVLDLPARDDKVTMLLDLPDSEDALMRSFKPKLRSQIRRPEKAGATVRAGGAELVADFYSVFARNMRDLGTPVYPRGLFDAVLRAFPEAAKIFVVDHGAQPVAAAFVVGHRSVLEIPWASSLREANNIGVNMLLYWSVLRDAVARGYRRFDFGRSTKDSGTYRFKEQWGAVPHQLRWHYWLSSGRELPRLNPSNPKYRFAISVWQRLPVSVANVLGPRIVKHLP